MSKTHIAERRVYILSDDGKTMYYHFFTESHWSYEHKVIVPAGVETVCLDGIELGADDDGNPFTIEELYLPKSVKNLDTIWVGGLDDVRAGDFYPGTFGDHETKIRISKSNPYLKTDGQSVYSADGKRLVYAFKFDNEYSIATSVEVIETGALREVGWQDIIIPSTVKLVKAQICDLNYESFDNNVLTIEGSETVFEGDFEGKKHENSYSSYLSNGIFKEIRLHAGSEAQKYCDEHGVEYITY